VITPEREAGFAGLAALVDQNEGAHGGNRVSPVIASARKGAKRKKACIFAIKGFGYYQTKERV
jgi:hypothetical protein